MEIQSLPEENRSAHSPRSSSAVRIILILLLLLLFCGGLAWWTVYIPYDPMAIYRPLPSHATLVTRHLRLADRWPQWIQNPLTKSLIQQVGGENSEWASLGNDDESQMWLQKLLGREIALAYLPRAYSTGVPAWVGVSWLGGESQWLRWQLSLFDVEGFEEMKGIPGHSVWKVDVDFLPPGQQLVLAFGEGVLMACLSSDPRSMWDVLNAYDGLRPRLMERDLFQEFLSQDNPDTPDRLWVAYSDVPLAPATRETPLTVDFSHVDEKNLMLIAMMEPEIPLPENRALNVSLSPLADLLQTTPCMAVSMQKEMLFTFASSFSFPFDGHRIVRWMTEVSSDRLFSFVLDGAYGGRLSIGNMSGFGFGGVRVPTWLLATPLDDSSDFKPAAERILDEANTYYRGSFILRPVQVPPDTVYVLESANGDEWVDALRVEDRPAYVVRQGWLVVASNFGVLRRCLRESKGREDSPVPEWVRFLSTDSIFQLWADLPRTRKVVGDGLALWTLYDRTAWETASSIREWMDAFAPMGQAALEVNRIERHARVRLMLSENP